MTIDQFISSLGISPAEQYTIKQVAGILDMAPSTVEYWCRVGLRLDGSRVPIVLTSFRKGHCVVIPGRCLIEFLEKRNEI
jgi:hypothetical protein